MDEWRYLDVADYLALAGFVLEVDPQALLDVVDLDLLDSALHAPQAGFGDIEFYPTLAEKAAVLYSHLAQNHCLRSDGNKRAAFAAMQMFLRRHGRVLTADPDEAAKVLEDVAARTMDEDVFLEWLRDHLTEDE